MKYCSISFLLFIIPLSGMEKTESVMYDYIPKDVINIIKDKLSDKIVCAKKHGQFCGEAAIRMSNTWNTLKITDEEIFDHQVWWTKTPTSSNTYLRFDNDVTRDWNNFFLRDIESLEEVRFDGPNHDGGEHNGIAVIAYQSDLGELFNATAFSLFKLHGCSSTDNTTSLQKFEYPNNSGKHRLKHYNFSNTFSFKHEMFKYCAIARKKMMIFATEDLQTQKNILRIYSYEVGPLSQIHRGETTFTINNESTRIIDYAFKKLCWIYGKSLVGISQNNELYILSPNGNTIDIHKQKIPINVKDVAVHYPDNPHELIFCDTKDNLYYANLADRNKDSTFKYHKIYDKEADKDKKSSFKDEIDRLWYFRNQVGIMNLTSNEIRIFSPLMSTFFTRNPGLIHAWIKKQKEPIK